MEQCLMERQFASAIYTGTVRHRRFSPKQHAFKYHVFMMYLDTREIAQVFSLSPFWSLKHFAPVQFKRSDFHIDAQHISKKNIDNPNLDIDHLPDIDESVRNTIESATGTRPTGAIRMLVNLRYWGVNMNPISTYYCFDVAGENVIAILAEVHNTPWNERHAYVLTGEDFSKKQHIHFAKEFHVSPFNPIAMEYRWHSTTPGHLLTLHLENWEGASKVMDATMTLKRAAISTRAMNKILIQFPWMTVKVIGAIYWQALQLWWKGVPIFNHSPSEKCTPPSSTLPVPINEEHKL